MIRSWLIYFSFILHSFNKPQRRKYAILTSNIFISFNSQKADLYEYEQISFIRRVI